MKDDIRLLQESNLTSRQPRRTPHHAIQETATCSRFLHGGVGFEPSTLRTEGDELTTELPRSQSTSLLSSKEIPSPHYQMNRKEQAARTAACRELTWDFVELDDLHLVIQGVYSVQL